MGKKFSQDSVKISKMSSSNKKINLNSLIKVLRPKVYITDSSTFKTLVQELTGNGNGITSPSPSPSPIPISIPSPRPNFSNTIISKPIDYGFQGSSPELSFDSSEATLSSNIPTQQLNMPTPLLSSSSDDDELQSYNWFGKYDNMSFPQYNGEIESSASCFLGMDDPFLYNYDDTAYAIPIMPQEVCVYDYDLSGIM